jgi:glycerophosphoryl diester phosphodiesterase
MWRSWPSAPATPSSNPQRLAWTSFRHLQDLARHARAKGARPVVASPSYLLLDKEGGLKASIARLKAAGFSVVPWTVNDKETMVQLMEMGVDGLITDAPDVLRAAVEQFNAQHGGTLIDGQGLIDPSRFDAQAHRGGRNLRPENTLPSFEAGLDLGMTTLETDTVVTADGVVVLSHSNLLDPQLSRRTDGREDPRFKQSFRTLTLSELRRDFRFDCLLKDRPAQRNDRALSPVAVAYAKSRGLADPYVVPTLEDLFAFVRFYEAYYRTGAGKDSPGAEQRWRNAARVRLSVEIKGSLDAARSGTTLPVVPFARAVARVVQASHFEDRVDLQSFTLDHLRVVHAEFPSIRTSYLYDR